MMNIKGRTLKREVNNTREKTTTVSGLTKSEYIKTLIVGKEPRSGMLDIALIYYHSKIPIEDAKIYMENILSNHA